MRKFGSPVAVAVEETIHPARFGWTKTRSART